MSYPNFYFGAVSKNVIDAVIETANSNEIELGIIASRNQSDYDSGYLGLKTSELHKYIRKRSEYVYLERDHGGPVANDDGKASFKRDANCMDIIHIDPFKMISSFDNCIEYTIDAIKYIYKLNSNVKFEIGTEDAVLKYSPYQLKFMIQELERKLNSDQFNNILFSCVQSGNKMNLLSGTNSNVFEDDRFLDFIDICYEFKIFSKEHNCDFLEPSDILNRFDLGLYAMNIAPELGRVESTFVWDYMINNQCYEELNQFYDLVISNQSYKKWLIGDTLDISKEDMCKAFGHYIFNNNSFIELKKNIKLQDDDIRKHLVLKINNYLDLIFGDSQDIEIDDDN